MDLSLSLFLSFSPSLLLSVALFLSLASSFALGNKLSDRIGEDLLGTGDFYVTGAPAPGILLCRGLELTCGLRITGGGSWRDILNCRIATGAHVAMNLRYAIPSVDTPPLIVVVVIVVSVVSVVIVVVTVGNDWRSANFRCRHTAIYPSLGP